MTSLMIAAFTASLLGSVHCAGMCGGFVALGLAGASTTRARVVAMSAYHFARGAAYALAGAVAGFAGAALDLGGEWAGLQRASAWLAAAVLLGMALAHLVRRGSASAGAGVIAKRHGSASLIQRGLRALAGAGPLRRGLTIGLLTVLLPCGWLALFLISAAASGAALSGALVMGAFWIGTVPILAGVAMGISTLGARLGRARPALMATLLALAALATLMDRALILSNEDESQPQSHCHDPR